jgi:hypothetical protein
MIFNKNCNLIVKINFLIFFKEEINSLISKKLQTYYKCKVILYIYREN